MAVQFLNMAQSPLQTLLEGVQSIGWPTCQFKASINVRSKVSTEYCHIPFEKSRLVKIKNKKEKIFYMDVLKTIHKKISNQKMKSKERDKSILEYVQCMYNNV